MPSASPWYASIAGRRVCTAPHAAAVPWSETALMRPKLTGSGIGARHAQGASTTSPARCWPDITSRCGSGCCACTSWALTQCCSFYDSDCGGDIDPGGWLWCARSQRIAAHLALDAARYLPTAAANHTLLQDLVQHRPMQGAPGPRGKARQTTAACGGPRALRAGR